MQRSTLIAAAAGVIFAVFGGWQYQQRAELQTDFARLQESAGKLAKDNGDELVKLKQNIDDLQQELGNIRNQLALAKADAEAAAAKPQVAAPSKVAPAVVTSSPLPKMTSSIQDSPLKTRVQTDMYQFLGTVAPGLTEANRVLVAVAIAESYMNAIKNMKGERPGTSSMIKAMYDAELKLEEQLDADQMHIARKFMSEHIKVLNAAVRTQ